MLQQFVTTAAMPGTIVFTGTSGAGSSVTFTNTGGGTVQSVESFEDNSSADHATFTCNPSPDRIHLTPGAVHFLDNATAGSASFTCNGGRIGGDVAFFDTSTAGDATFVANGGPRRGDLGGVVQVGVSSSACNGLYVANGTGAISASGGVINLRDTATGGTATFIANAGSTDGGRLTIDGTPEAGSARFEVFGIGSLDVSGLVSTVTIGSLEGDGLVFLGGKLVDRCNALTTTFFGDSQRWGDFGTRAN
jgi:hypothetical protein